MLATPMRAKPSSDAHARTSASSAEASKELLAVEVLTRKGYAVAPYNGEWAAPDATGPCIVEPEIHTAARALPDRIHTRRRRGDRGAGERARPYVSGRRDGSGEPASGGRSGRRQDHLRPQLPARLGRRGPDSQPDVHAGRDLPAGCAHLRARRPLPAQWSGGGRGAWAARFFRSRLLAAGRVGEQGDEGTSSAGHRLGVELRRARPPGAAARARAARGKLAR